MGKLDGKVAIITGGGGGIGSATARLFSHEGAKIVLADWQPEAGEAVAQAIRTAGGEATFIKTNVAKAGDIKAMVNHALSAYRRIDILMNNAGVGSTPAPIHATDDDDWNHVVDVCLKGVFLGMKYTLPQMMEQGSGTIINVASVAGIMGAVGLAPYAAAKAGVIELTKVAAVEYSRYNIRCNTIAPGWTSTQMAATYINDDEATEQKMIKSIPMRRFGEPEEIAHAALLLAGDDVRYLQGHTLVIDGGLTIV